MKYLFVGGAMNGNRIEVHGEQFRVVIAEADFPPLSGIEPPKEDELVPVEYHEYRAFPIRVDDTDFIIYAVDRMRPTQVIQALIDNYNPQGKPHDPENRRHRMLHPPR